MTVFFEPWLNWQHLIVRQLAFAVASPNTIGSVPGELQVKYGFALHDNPFWQQQYLRYTARLQALDQNPQPLLDFLAGLKSTRLGLRFEHLLWFWLNDSLYHDYELLGHSIQIIHGGNTLGELDFLLYNHASHQIEHWEVALKFYLAEADFSLPHWYGLNRSDTLYRKLHHFGHQQFQFERVQTHLIQQRFAVLKGQLYFPEPQVQSRMTENAVPDWVNPARRTGTWGNLIAGTDYYRLQRQEWICVAQEQSSADAHWWTNGLYKNKKNEHYYMLRQPCILHKM
ncbi:DUF1853 family protein [Acinetobacter sp. WZC-1]|uniref:DUF1853 family protein n=1 Tax=Acinetobacter sp. WZC-1 TaxID=3459034 RepID=UPI00403DCA6B